MYLQDIAKSSCSFAVSVRWSADLYVYVSIWNILLPLETDLSEILCGFLQKYTDLIEVQLKYEKMRHKTY